MIARAQRMDSYDPNEIARQTKNPSCEENTRNHNQVCLFHKTYHLIPYQSGHNNPGYNDANKAIITQQVGKGEELNHQ